MPPRSNRLPLITIGIAVALCGVATWVFAESADLEAMKRKVRSKFPEVAQLSTAELAAWLSDSKRKQPVLLDVRTEEEFAISHLQGAIRVDPSAEAIEVRSRLPSGRPVVAYCSVGYRSSVLAERLRKAGVAPIYNLEGSIFQWANEGRPIEVGGRSAEKVHPFNRTYGKMLDEAKRAKP